MQYQYRDRRTKKRDFRKLWIQRINAGAKEHGVSSLWHCAVILSAQLPQGSYEHHILKVGI